MAKKQNGFSMFCDTCEETISTCCCRQESEKTFWVFFDEITQYGDPSPEDGHPTFVETYPPVLYGPFDQTTIPRQLSWYRRSIGFLVLVGNDEGQILRQATDDELQEQLTFLSLAARG